MKSACNVSIVFTDKKCSNIVTFIFFYREDLKKDYDTQLHHELEALRQRTHLEIEQLKLHTREVYEQEIR